MVNECEGVKKSLAGQPRGLRIYQISNIEEEIKGPKLVLFLIPILKAPIKAKN